MESIWVLLVCLSAGHHLFPVRCAARGKEVVERETLGAALLFRY
jgi:hypothetical protein